MIVTGATETHRACQACVTGTGTVVVERVVRNYGAAGGHIVDHLHLCANCAAGRKPNESCLMSVGLFAYLNLAEQGLTRLLDQLPDPHPLRGDVNEAYRIVCRVRARLADEIEPG